jgi:hypothetical protein
MLAALRTGSCFRAAITIAAFAALCFVAPPGLLAFGHGENTVECLAHADMVNHGTAKAHDIGHHGDHSVPSGAHQPGSGCCGLFCMSALAADAGQTVDRIEAGIVLSPAIEARPFSRVPERPDRPPISLLFV